MDFENGVIVKIYNSQVDHILVGGRLRHPQTKMGISSGPMTFFLENDPKGGPLDDFFPFSHTMFILIKQSYLYTQLHKHISVLFMDYISQINIQFGPSFFVAVCVVIILLMLCFPFPYVCVCVDQLFKYSISWLSSFQVL